MFSSSELLLLGPLTESTRMTAPTYNFIWKTRATWQHWNQAERKLMNIHYRQVSWLEGIFTLGGGGGGGGYTLYYPHSPAQHGVGLCCEERGVHDEPGVLYNKSDPVWQLELADASGVIPGHTCKSVNWECVISLITNIETGVKTKRAAHYGSAYTVISWYFHSLSTVQSIPSRIYF